MVGNANERRASAICNIIQMAKYWIKCCLLFIQKITLKGITFKYIDIDLKSFLHNFKDIRSNCKIYFNCIPKQNYMRPSERVIAITNDPTFNRNFRFMLCCLHYSFVCIDYGALYLVGAYTENLK